MTLFNLISKHFWLMCIAVTIFNVLIMRKRAKSYIEKDPNLLNGYRVILKGLLIWGNMPWLVMGLGILRGGVPSIWNFFRPQDGNPYVIAWYTSVFIIWILGTYWLFVKNGAELLVSHPGIFNINFSSAKAVKLVWLLCLSVGIVAFIMMFIRDIPIPV